MPNPLPEPLPSIWSSPFAPDESPAKVTPSLGAGGRPRASRVRPERLWAALSAPMRWRLVLRMAQGEELTAPMAARGATVKLSAVRRHLAALRRAGVIGSRAGLDRRSEVFFLPAERRPEPGVLDFGSCRITLAEEA